MMKLCWQSPRSPSPSFGVLCHKFWPLVLRTYCSLVNINNISYKYVQKYIIYIFIPLGYGMTQGFPTIAIPAIQDSSSSSFTLTKEQISWLSKQYIIP